MANLFYGKDKEFDKAVALAVLSVLKDEQEPKNRTRQEVLKELNGKSEITDRIPEKIIPYANPKSGYIHKIFTALEVKELIKITPYGKGPFGAKQIIDLTDAGKAQLDDPESLKLPIPKNLQLTTSRKR